jgi:hypothetical protein
MKIIPVGVCQCGCGEPTTNIYSRHGRRILGKNRFIHGHNATTHGGAYTSEHSTWGHMFQRCYNPKNSRFSDYGGRGIRVCNRWNPTKGGSFKNFLADMGKKPSPQHSIERTNNDRSYTPSNCCWATRSQQQYNRRNCPVIPIKDLVHAYEQGETLRSLGRRFNAEAMTIRRRLLKEGVNVRVGHSGWSWKPTNPDEVIRLYVNEQWSPLRIAKQFNVGVSTIRWFLKRTGVTIRRRKPV